jgi:hypothetical protein
LKRKQRELDKQERGPVDDDKWYDEYILIGLLTNEHVFSLNIFLDNMFFEYEFFIQCLLNLVTGGYKEFEDLTKHANRVLSQFEDAFKNQEDNTSKDIIRSKLQSSIGDIKEAERDYTKKMKTLSRKFLSLHYFMIKSLGRSCAAKFFIDHNWRNLWDRYYVSTNIFKNICESNNQTFKVFLSDFKPKFGSFNFLNKDTTVIEEFFTHLRPIMMNSKFWVNTATKEMPSDQVEKLPLVFRYMELLSVFVNEGCLRNQSILFMLGERYWQGIMQRMPDDIHSSIYQLKVSTVKFLIALIDKSSEIITNYMGYHFPPSYISELIYVHMKKLFCAAYLENDHTKLAMIREKGESEAFKKLSESQQERMRYLKSIEVEVRNPATSHKEDLGGCFEISEEVASEIRIDSFEQMKEVYLSSTQMYGHPLMELSFQLTKFMNAMAQLSPVYRLYVDYLNTQVVNVYGAEAPGRIKKAAKIDIAYDFDRERRPENIEIHMAMASFTEVVEIENNHHVQPDTANGEEKEVKEQPATIENSFIRPPESFMLTEQTKERILRGVPVGQVVETIQHSLNKLHIEMRCRLGIRRKYKWLYVLGGDRIMDIHKKIVWFFSFAVNLLMGFKNQSLVEKTTQSLFAGTNPVELALEVLAVLSTVYSLLHLVIWTLNKYTEVVETVLYEYAMAEEALLTMARRKKSLIAKAITYFETMILKPFLTMSTPVMFILQALFNVLGLYVSEVFFTLNLWMVVLLGGRNESILVSIRDNWVKMGLTLAMTLFVTYSTGFIGTAAGSAKKCDTLWGCVTDVLGFGTGEGKSGGSEAIITNLIFGTVVASFTSQQTQDKEIGIS